MDLEKIKNSIKPDEKAVWKKANDFLKKINNSIKKNKINAEAVVGGSLAKGTFLKGDHDIDIYVKFSKEYETEKLSDLLEKILKPLKPERVHGSRDYFIKAIGNIKYEIIPVYDVKDATEIVNITDASILHFKWLDKQTRKNPKIRDEIRLAKAFCKSAGIYGAESYIKGFSGHVLDIVTVYYGSFIDLIKNAAKWRKKQVIDFYNVYKGNALKELNKSKIQSPLIVIDPVQPERNAAAALSDEMFFKFIEKAKAFLKKPSEKFFSREEFSVKKIKKKNTIIIEIKPLSGKKDVVGSKLLKALEEIRDCLEKNGFEVNDYGWHWNKIAYFWFRMKKMKIPRKYVHEGPPLKAKKNVEQFKKKYKDTFVRGERIYANVERKLTNAKEMIKSALKIDYIAKNFKSAKII